MYENENMTKNINYHNIKNIVWPLAMILVFFCSAILAFIGWVFYLSYLLFYRLNILKKNDLVS